MEIKLECCIALTPSSELECRIRKVSQRIAKSNEKGGVILTLQCTDRILSLAPHLTLYQLCLPLHNVQSAGELLCECALTTPELNLKCFTFSDDPSEGSIELKYTAIDELLSLQTRIVEKLNGLRENNLLEYNPAGLSVQKIIRESVESPALENLKAYGFPEFGAPTFNPHVTLNWMSPGVDVFKRPIDGTYSYVEEGDEEDPHPTQFSGAFTHLSLYVMGPQGTCPQLLASYKMEGASR